MSKKAEAPAEAPPTGSGNWLNDPSIDAVDFIIGQLLVLASCEEYRWWALLAAGIMFIVKAVW